MMTLRIVSKLERIQNLSMSEKRSTAAAFNNSAAVIGCITDYLNSEIDKTDALLNNPLKLYDNEGADLKVAFLIAGRAHNMKLLQLLTEEIEVLDADQAKDI